MSSSSFKSTMNDTKFNQLQPSSTVVDHVLLSTISEKGDKKIPSISAGSTQNLTQDEIREKPWKYIGYDGYTNFIASENDFFMLRRFASVSTRVALSLQDEVVVLEEKLAALDQKYSRREARDVSNGSFRDDEDDRKEVLDLLRQKLVIYNEFVLQQAELKKHPSASQQDIQSLENWHWNHENRAVSLEEHAYLQHKSDLFSVVPKARTPLRKLLERSKWFRVNALWKNPKAPELPVYDKDVITYISDKRIDRFVTFLIITLGLVLLIAPMWILQFLTKPVSKLGTITAFIIVFLAIVSYTTVAKSFEALAAAAGYSAVLMVFLQLGGTSKSAIMLFS